VTVEVTWRPTDRVSIYLFCKEHNLGPCGAQHMTSDPFCALRLRPSAGNGGTVARGCSRCAFFIIFCCDSGATHECRKRRATVRTRCCASSRLRASTECGARCAADNGCIFLETNRPRLGLFILQRAQSVLAPQNLGSVLVLCDCDRPPGKPWLAHHSGARCFLIIFAILGHPHEQKITARRYR
jgi:hypothetical protein